MFFTWLRSEKRKIEIAKTFRNSLKKGYQSNILCNECYKAFITECIVKGKDEFRFLPKKGNDKKSLERYLKINGFRIQEERHYGSNNHAVYYIARL